MTTAPIPTTTSQWLLYRRLQLAGCPIDLDRFEEPVDPVRLIHQPAPLGTDLFPLGDRTGVAIGLHIVPSRKFKVHSANLTNLSAWDWLPYCEQHESYCFHGCLGGDVRFGSGLNHPMFYPMEPGQPLQGYLLMVLNKAVAPSGTQPVHATLTLCDPIGRSHEYWFSLNNCQRIDAYSGPNCWFLDAAALEDERAEKEAEAKRLVEEAAQQEVKRAQQEAEEVLRKYQRIWPDYRPAGGG